MPADCGGAALPTLEQIYSEAGDDLASVPWARLAPHPLLLLWLHEGDPPSRAAGHAAPGTAAQIRDIDDDISAALSTRAAEAGVTVPELLRRQAARLASRPTIRQWLERTRRRPSEISHADITEALDELRGPWPDADR